jgi:hypothetical protein
LRVAPFSTLPGEFCPAIHRKILEHLGLASEGTAEVKVIIIDFLYNYLYEISPKRASAIFFGEQWPQKQEQQ